jgi:hypothetical protein
LHAVAAPQVRPDMDDAGNATSRTALAAEARLRTRESRAATLRGWRRSFRICVVRFRGVRGLNGLVVALDTGRVSG